MELLPNIYRLNTPMGKRVVYQYLFVGDKVLLFDTGLDSSVEDTVLPYLATIGLNVERLNFALVSHADGDHLGGNESLKRVAPQVLLMAHNLDIPLIENVERLIEERYQQFQAGHGLGLTVEVADWIRQACKSDVPIDIGLEGGETIRLGADWPLKVLHTPGHTYGHISLYDPNNRVAVIGDAVLGHGVPDAEGRSITLPPTYIYVDTYLNTIKALLGMPIDTLLTGHYPVMRGKQVTEFLYESLAFARRVEERLLQAIRDAKSPLSMKDLIGAVSGVVGDWPVEETTQDVIFPFSGHLQRLENFGLIRREIRNGLVAWQGN